MNPRRQMPASLAMVCLLLTGPYPAHAASCILSVDGEEPLSDIEAEQPYRLGMHPITLPGYTGLLLRPLNRPGRSEFYEIDGRTYREIREPAPGSNIFDSDVKKVSSGDRFLLGWTGRIVWHLPVGATDWRQLRPGERWWASAYDEGVQELYISFGENARVLVWADGGFVTAGPLPGFAMDGTPRLSISAIPRAIHTVAEAGGTFAIGVERGNEDRRSVWFRPFGGDWTLVAEPSDLEEIVPGQRFPGPFRDVDVTDDGRTVRLFAAQPGEATILLRHGSNGWALEDALPFHEWVTQASSGVRLAWIGEMSQNLTERFLLWEYRVEPNPPVLHSLQPGSVTPQPLSDVEPVRRQTGDRIFYHSYLNDIPGMEPLLIRASDGWHAFDGEALTALPSLAAERVGDLAQLGRVGPLVLVQSPTGVFVLEDDLTAERVVSFPTDEPHAHDVTIEYLERADLFVVVTSRSDVVHVTADFERFESITSPSMITSAVAQLPDRAALLLVGSDGLYTFEAECPTERN